VVGRELPNLRPNGEDHRGASGGIIQRTMGVMTHSAGGKRGSVWWRSWTLMRMRIHKALVWLLQWEIGLLVIRFGLRV